MPTQKFCSVNGCNEFIFVKLNDLAENEWNAFQIGKSKVLCFCPKHQKEMKEKMGELLEGKEKGQ